MMIDNNRQAMLVAALAGATVAAFGEIIRDMAKELRRCSGSQFDRRIDEMEARALRQIGKADFDYVPLEDQRFLAEQMERIIAAAFSDVRLHRL